MNKNRMLYWGILLMSIVFIFVGYKVFKLEQPYYLESMTYEKASIVKILDVSEEAYSLGGDITDLKRKVITFEADILSGEYKGTTVQGSQNIDEINPVNPDQIQEGDKVLIGQSVFEQGLDQPWIFMDFHRSQHLAVIVLLFLVLIILFGLKKGVNTVVTLILTCATIFLIFIPAILKGTNIYSLTICLTSFIILMNFLILNGSSKKTWSAIVGNIGGILISGILAYLSIKWLRLTGLIDNEVGLLISLNTETPIDILAVIWSGIVIGSLGAIMDVAITIASALNELSENMYDRQFKILWKSGLTIGRDAMGTMTNTLILAYIGSSLSTVLLLVASNKNLTYLFNMEMIAVEVLQAIIGSIGILLAIPVTSLVAAYIFSNVKRDIKE